jgi:SAM-dependent methyltransferase
MQPIRFVLSMHGMATMTSPFGLEGSPKLWPLLVEVRQRVLEVASDLLPLFDIYAREASFGANVIERDLHYISSSGRILEIGAGILLLSCFLQKEGHAVTALEPAGKGFSHFERLRGIVLDYARAGGFEPVLLTIPAEKLDVSLEYDYAFSINVMEHVGDVAAVLRRVFSAIKPGGRHRFLCPNYLFPYEPHFNIPTLFSKTLTERLFGKYIRASQAVVDPEGTWASLNWISVAEVRRICCKELQVEPVFDRSVLLRFIHRALSDDEFQKRRSPLILHTLRALDRLGITRLLMRMPVVCQPVMDCVIVRP